MHSTKATPVTAKTSEQALRSLARIFGLLERVMQPYFARFGISGSQWSVLRNLQRAEAEGAPGLRLTDLSDRLLIRPPSVTGVVDRLERGGLVDRSGSSIDLRTKHVSLTPQGRELVERILQNHGRLIDRVMGVLTAEEQAELHRLLSRLGDHLEGLSAQALDDLG